MTNHTETAVRDIEATASSTASSTTDSVEAGLAASPADPVRAEHVEISQGSAGSIEATTVALTQGGAGRVRAHEMTVNQGGIGLARTDRLQLGERASAFAVISDEAALEPGSSVFMLLARSVSGDVRPIVDWRAAAAFGVGLGLAVSILRRRGR